MTDQLVRAHAVAELEHQRGIWRALEERLREYEARGLRIVDGGQIGGGAWRVTDYRTGEEVASGTSEASLDELLDSDDPPRWIFVDPVLESCCDASHPVTEGLPESLCEAIEMWIGMLATPSAEIAEFVGWPVEDVARCRDEGAA